MGFVPPPPPISREEFHKRYAAGARTMQELDPAFWAWRERQRRFRMVQGGVMVIGLLMLLAVFMLKLLI